MIIRSRRNKESLLTRILGLPFSKRPSYGPFVVSANEFLLELAKETSRSNRRTVNREFAVALVEFENLPDITSAEGAEAIDKLAGALKQRLRITDVIGWYDNKFAVLLPETTPEGARRVSGDISRLATSFGHTVSVKVLIYPWDDGLAAGSDELEKEVFSNSDYYDPSPVTSIEDDEQVFVDEDEELASAFEAMKKEVVMSSLSPVADNSIERMTAFSDDFPTPWWKRAIDIVCSGAGLIILSPVLLIASAAIWTTSKGPVFFKQAREGKDGRIFNIWKFRTMRVDAEDLQRDLRKDSEQDGPAFKLTNDPRVTTVGKYLRKSCIDELPQLLNILRGEMSVVGPRPLPVKESAGCQGWQRQRLRVLPGLTCIWQLDGGRNVKFDEWMRMDMEYLRKRSFLYDCRLIAKTAVVALMHRGSV